MAISINSITAKGVKMSKAPGAFDPVTFWSGQQGGFWDFSNSANLFSNNAMTTPATLDGSVLAVTDISGLDNHLTNVAGGRSFVRKSGWCEVVDGPLQTPAFTRTQTGYTSLMLFRIATMDYGYIVSAPLNADYSMLVTYLPAAGLTAYVWGNAIQDQYGNPEVLSNSVDYFGSSAVNDNATTPIMSVRVNGSTVSGGTVQTLAVAESRISIGANGSTNVLGNNEFTGRLYCAAWINKTCTLSEIQEIGNYMNTLAGTSATV